MVFDRTFHPDEANQAFTVGKLLETGVYAYNPSDHHGPTLYYAAAPVQRLCGAAGTASLEEIPLRCVPLAFAVLTVVFAFLAARRLFAWRAARAPLASALLAVLPLATLPILFFFATYFVQEALFGCFLALMLWSGVEYGHARARPGRVKPGSWAVLFGIGAGLAFATKETSAVAFFAAAAAAAPFFLRARRAADGDAAAAVWAFPARAHLVLAAAAGLLAAVALFSSFGARWDGVWAAFVEAPLAYLGRARGAAASAGAADHVHPWWWYFKVLFGCPIFHLRALGALFAAGLLAARRAGRAWLFLALYTAASFAVYALIPYKTPWCMLTVAEAFALAAGLSLAAAPALLRGDGGSPARPAWRRALAGPVRAAAVLAVGLWALHAQYRLCRKIAAYPDSPLIPYNYANASWDVKNAASFIAERLALAGPESFAAVCLPPEDTWPMPWYLRRANAGYWTGLDALPVGGPHPEALVLLADDPANGRVAARFPELNGSAVYGIRPGVLVSVHYREEAEKEAE